MKVTHVTVLDESNGKSMSVRIEDAIPETFDAVCKSYTIEAFRRLDVDALQELVTTYLNGASLVAAECHVQKDVFMAAVSEVYDHHVSAHVKDVIESADTLTPEELDGDTDRCPQTDRAVEYDVPCAVCGGTGPHTGPVGHAYKAPTGL